MNAVVTAAPVNRGPAPTGGGAQRTPTPVNMPGAFSFYPVTQEERPKYLKIMIYGAAGTGKTTLAGSACNDDALSDVLLVTAEGGDIVFQQNERIQRPDRIDMMKVERIEQLQKVYEWLKAHVGYRDRNEDAKLKSLQNIAFTGNKDTKDEDMPEQFRRVRKYKTVILDSMTDIEALNMNQILGVADKGFEVGDEMAPAGYTEFRKNNNTIQQLVRAFRNLPINLIIICGQKYGQDEQKRYHYTPWMTGQLATQTQSFVDVVGYMVIGAGENGAPINRLYVQPQAAVRFDAKCRIASIKKPAFDDPMFIDIMNAFWGKS